MGNVRFSCTEEMQLMSNPWVRLEIHWQTMPFSTDFKLLNFLVLNQSMLQGHYRRLGYLDHMLRDSFSWDEFAV